MPGNFGTSGNNVHELKDMINRDGADQMTDLHQIFLALWLNYFSSTAPDPVPLHEDAVARLTESRSRLAHTRNGRRGPRDDPERGVRGSFPAPPVSVPRGVYCSRR
jgi:hypothetical protein